MRRKKKEQQGFETDLTPFYAPKTIYLDGDGYFTIVNGAKLWFANLGEAKEATGFTRVFCLYNNKNANQNGTELSK